MTQTLKNYPYGKVTKRLEKAYKFVIDNIDNIKQFDFPDYGGMPKSLSNKLSPDEVDWLQSIVNGSPVISDKDFYEKERRFLSGKLNSKEEDSFFEEMNARATWISMEND